jgi:hypothetical protein
MRGNSAGDDTANADYGTVTDLAPVNENGAGTNKHIVADLDASVRVTLFDDQSGFVLVVARRGNDRHVRADTNVVADYDAPGRASGNVIEAANRAVVAKVDGAAAGLDDRPGFDDTFLAEANSTPELDPGRKADLHAVPKKEQQRREHPGHRVALQGSQK